MEDKITFEKKLEKLEKIARAIEDSKTELEKSVELFEEGMKLADDLNKQLSKIERKIEVVISSASSLQVVTEPYK